MPSAVGTRRRFAVRLAVITAIAFAWRVTYVVWMRSRPVLEDGQAYHRAANLLVDGRGFINPITLAITGKAVPDAVHPPAWTVVLAAGGFLGMHSTLWQQLIACVVGSLTVAVTGLAGRAAFNSRVGLIAAALAAAYANLWLYERELFSEVLALLGVATIIWLAYRYRARPSIGTAIALGAVVAVSALTRSELILASVLIVTPVILGTTKLAWGQRFARLVVAGLACVAVITPWYLYNTTRFSQPVPLSVGLGETMRTGNCPKTFSGPMLGYYSLNCILFVPQLSSDPSVADGQWRRVTISFMRQHQSELPKVVAARLGRAFDVYRPLQQMHLEAERGTSIWVIRLGAVMYWVLVPFAIAGAVLARRLKVPIYPFVAFLVIVVIAVSLTIGAVRYRAPLEIPIVLLASLTFDHIYRWWTRRDTSEDRSRAVHQPAVGAGTSS
jgi:4-amino-4-deoxy-L-arabinose transferase-like glycosyltransferase